MSRLFNHSIASGEALKIAAGLDGYARKGHTDTMWFIVWFAAPQSHAGLEMKPHLKRQLPHRPWLVLIRFSRTQLFLGRLKPGTCVVGSLTLTPLTKDEWHHLFRHADWESKFALIRFSASFNGGFLDWSLSAEFGMSECIGRSAFPAIFLYSLSNAFLRLKSGGSMLLKTGSHSVGVDLTEPVIVRIAIFNWVSTFEIWLLFNHTGAAYSAVE